MSNVQAPFGLAPKRMIDGSPLNFQTQLLFYNSTDATNIFVGDLLVAGTQSSTSNPNYLPACKQAAASSAATMGVCVGVDPIIAFGGTSVGNENLIRKYAPSGTSTFIQVCRDARVVFHIQLGNSASSLPIADISGLYAADINTGTAGSTTTGVSGMVLDRGTLSTSVGTLPLGVIGFAQTVGNDPASGYATIEVRLRTCTVGTTAV